MDKEKLINQKESVFCFNTERYLKEKKAKAELLLIYRHFFFFR